jgi:hypothetical protein
MEGKKKKGKGNRSATIHLQSHERNFAVNLLQGKVQPVKRYWGLECIRGHIVEKKRVKAELGARRYLFRALLKSQHSLPCLDQQNDAKQYVEATPRGRRRMRGDRQR